MRGRHPELCLRCNCALHAQDSGYLGVHAWYLASRNRKRLAKCLDTNHHRTSMLKIWLYHRARSLLSITRPKAVEQELSTLLDLGMSLSIPSLRQRPQLQPQTWHRYLSTSSSATRISLQRLAGCRSPSVASRQSSVQHRRVLPGPGTDPSAA